MKKDVKRAFCTKGIGYKKKKRGQKKFSEGLAKNACYILFGKKNIALGQIINTKYFIDGFLAKEASNLREVIERLEFYDDAFIYERADENNDVVSRDARNVGKMLVIALPNSTTDEEDDEFIQGLLSMIPDDCVKIAKMHYRSKSRQKHKHLHVLYTERSYVIGPVHEMFMYGENGSRSEFNKRVDEYIRNTLERFGYDVDSAWKFDEVKAEYVSALEKTKRVVSPRFFNEKIALELKKVDKDLRIDYDDIEQLKDIYEIAYLKDDQIAMNWYEKKIEEYYERHEVERFSYNLEEKLSSIYENRLNRVDDSIDKEEDVYYKIDDDIITIDDGSDLVLMKKDEREMILNKKNLIDSSRRREEDEIDKENYINEQKNIEIQNQASLGNEFFGITNIQRNPNRYRKLAKRVDPNSQQYKNMQAILNKRKLKSSDNILEDSLKKRLELEESLEKRLEKMMNDMNDTSIDSHKIKPRSR